MTDMKLFIMTDIIGWIIKYTIDVWMTIFLIDKDCEYNKKCYQNQKSVDSVAT